MALSGPKSEKQAEGIVMAALKGGKFPAEPAKLMPGLTFKDAVPADVQAYWGSSNTGAAVGKVVVGNK